MVNPFQNSPFECLILRVLASNLLCYTVPTPVCPSHVLSTGNTGEEALGVGTARQSIRGGTNPLNQTPTRTI